MPLSLETYFFPLISIAANPSFLGKTETYDPQVCKFQGTLEFEGTARLRGNFLLTIESGADKSVPYDVRVETFATFDFDASSLDHAQTEDLFHGSIRAMKQSAVAMIYGALRELVASISGRQPWGVFIMPTIPSLQENVSLVLSNELEALEKSLTSPRASAG